LIVNKLKSDQLEFLVIHRLSGINRIGLERIKTKIDELIFEDDKRQERQKKRGKTT
jgi:hypothetical protein